MYGSAPYLPTSAGCVFDKGVVPVISYSRSDTRVTQAATHIWDAFHDPDSTVPLTPGKIIPGNVNSNGLWIHRTTDTSLQDANSAKAKSVCQANWPNYSLEGNDCDESHSSRSWKGPRWATATTPSARSCPATTSRRAVTLHASTPTTGSSTTTGSPWR